VAVMFLLVGVVLLPGLFGDSSGAPLVGPDLSTFEYEEVEFFNGDLRLAGMIFVPEGEGPFPVAVIIHGSGSSRRNSKWYLSVTRHLQDNGIAVLLPDKRGCEKSEGNWVGANFDDLAGDTLAAVEFVRNWDEMDFSKIGLVGMSQGGWIAPVAAAEDKDIAFVVSMSGSTVTTDQQLLHEEVHNISEFTWPFIARLIAPMTTQRIQRMAHFQPISGFDPIPYWKKVCAPKFFAFGENDPNVPVQDSVEVLGANAIDGLIKVYHDGGHAIRSVETNGVQIEFLDDLVEFIRTSTDDLLVESGAGGPDEPQT
ncbi:MAG: alpha/beta fold hydrolase, partial [Acidobacteria bacterium]|nr:alpha/beta fold hydrolase [Candidatus Sulfomarinibacter kjeldsenii]